MQAEVSQSQDQYKSNKRYTVSFLSKNFNINIYFCIYIIIIKILQVLSYHFI